MRIIEIVYSNPMETFIQRHVAALQEMNISPVLVARSEVGNEAQPASIQKTDLLVKTMPNFDRINGIQKISNLRYIISNFHRAPYQHARLRDRVLLSFFSSLQPDLIHFHFASLAQQMWWIPVALGIPYTMSLRGSDIQVNPLVSQKTREDLQAAFDHVEGIHTVSEHLWDQALPYIRKDIFHQTIYTTVPSDFDLPSRLTSNSEKNFVTVGRLHWTKNLVDLLKAFSIYRSQTGQGKLTIIGNGPELESLLYWRSILDLEQHVCFAGKLSYGQFRDVLRQSDAYIQSSIAEGFSNATAEAMALGCPVFATNVGGTDEIIQDGENGFLLDALDPNNWWKKLNIVRDQEIMSKIAMNAQMTARNTFLASKHGLAFKGFFERVLGDVR